MSEKKFFDLSGQVAIVTGGARGIGRAIALALADMGADIVVSDLLVDPALEVVKEIQKKSRKAIAIKCDVTNEADVNKMVKEAMFNFGKLNILINNAGVTKVCPAVDITLNDFNKVVNINFIGLFVCCQVAGRIMVKQRSGKIINIASVTGFIGSAAGTTGGVAYHSSKSAVIALTRQLAVEWGEYNVNVNTICPGFVATDLTRKRLENKEWRDSMIEKMPLRRIGMPEDLVGGVIYLASQASNWMTGQSIVIDGGFLALK